MKPVEGVDPPGLNGEATVIGDWIVGFDGQTGKLDAANDRIVNGHSTIAKCESRDAAAVKKATRRKFLGLF